MKGRPMFFGVDVSKRWLEVAEAGKEETTRFSNDTAGCDAILEKVRGATLVVMEATGRYEARLATHLAAHRVPIAVVNPRQTRDFARSTGKLAKTDGVDARVLAMYAQRIEPPETVLKDQAVLELEALLMRRRQLVDNRTAELNRREHATGEVLKSVEQHIVWLNTEIKKTDSEMGKRLRDSSLWNARIKLLRTAPGIGTVGSCSMVACVPELGTLTGKRIAALVGLAPFNDDSGARTGVRHIRGGRAEPRMVLYMATLTAIRVSPVFKEFYERLVRRGKNKKVALIACMRKLLEILNAMVRTNAKWNPNLAAPKDSIAPLLG